MWNNLLQVNSLRLLHHQWQHFKMIEYKPGLSLLHCSYFFISLNYISSVTFALPLCLCLPFFLTVPKLRGSLFGRAAMLSHTTLDLLPWNNYVTCSASTGGGHSNSTACNKSWTNNQTKFHLFMRRIKRSVDTMH